MTVYANVGHILLKRGNTVQSTAYKGPLGELTLDTDLHTVRVHDGKTFGGNVILASNTEVWALSNSISTITGLDAGFISNINTLLSNAATQATSLTTLTANAAAQATDITNLWSNAATQSSAITTLQGQVGQTYGNANVAAYLPAYTGNVSSGNISTTGSVNIGSFLQLPVYADGAARDAAIPNPHPGMVVYVTSPSNRVQIYTNGWYMLALG